MYKIYDVKFGITDGGMCCGPCDGSIVVSIYYGNETKKQWLNCVEVFGIPCFYLTDSDIFNDLLKEDVENQEYMECLEKSAINDFDGIELGEYDIIFNSIKQSSNLEAINLIRAMILLVRADMSEMDDLIASFKNKEVLELEIPLTDLEED